jgi:hypothetical protein
VQQNLYSEIRHHYLSVRRTLETLKRRPANSILHPIHSLT